MHGALGDTSYGASAPEALCVGLQLWACCNEHKLAALALVLKDLPYLGKTEVLLEA